MDVFVAAEMAASPRRVAAIMFDPSRDPEWIGGARSVDPAVDPTAIGALTRRHGGFLGKKFSWMTEVVEHERDALLRMKFVEGPMHGEVSYRIEPQGDGSRVSIRNQGGAGFALPGMAWMLRRSVAKDLDRLKRLVETS
jgi:hypothetical protein